jgi:hypothetical protein
MAGKHDRHRCCDAGAPTKDSFRSFLTLGFSVTFVVDKMQIERKLRHSASGEISGRHATSTRRHPGMSSETLITYETGTVSSLLISRCLGCLWVAIQSAEPETAQIC